MEEEKIKEEILKEEIQNEILLPGVEQVGKLELAGDQKKKQWEKCMEGLAKHRAIKKKQTEEEKLRKAQEKLAMKQRIREELERQKMEEEVKKELEKKEQVPVVQVTSVESSKEPNAPEFSEFEEFLQWKKFQNQKKQKVVEQEKSRKKIKKIVTVTEKSEESSDESEVDDFIPNPYHEKYKVLLEEEEEKVAKERYKALKKLPPKANLRRDPSHYSSTPESQQTDYQPYYEAKPPGKYFYI